MQQTRNSGFTLIELMVTVAIAAMVLTMGVPSFQSTVRSNRLTTSANGFLGALAFARSEAVKRGANVSLCKSVKEDDNPNNKYLKECIAPAGGGSEYESGWIVFVDYDGKGSIDKSTNIDASTGIYDDAVLRVYEALPTGVDMKNDSDLTFVSYRSNGSLKDSVSFTICAKDSTAGRRVYLTKAGRPNVAEHTCSP